MEYSIIEKLRFNFNSYWMESSFLRKTFSIFFCRLALCSTDFFAVPMRPFHQTWWVTRILCARVCVSVWVCAGPLTMNRYEKSKNGIMMWHICKWPASNGIEVTVSAVPLLYLIELFASNMQPCGRKAAKAYQRTAHFNISNIHSI